MGSPPPSLIRHLAALRHDLGKYVALQVRGLALDPGGPDPATADDLRSALIADLVHTRRGPDGTTDAAALFAALAPPLRGEAPLPSGDRVDLRGDPDFDALAAAMARLEPVITTLASGGDCDLRGAAADAIEVSHRCRALHRRLQGGGGG